MPIGPSNASAELVPTCDVAVTLGTDFDLTAQFNSGYARELYVGVGGTVVTVMRDSAGVACTYLNVPNGGKLTGYFVTVKSSGNGTTATNIIARR